MEKLIPAKVAPYAKAFATLVFLIVSALALVITGTEGFGDVTLAEWIAAIAFIVLGTGLVYAVPNTTKG